MRQHRPSASGSARPRTILAKRREWQLLRIWRVAARVSLERGTLMDGKHERLKARRTGSQAFDETLGGVSLEGYRAIGPNG